MSLHKSVEKPSVAGNLRTLALLASMASLACTFTIAMSMVAIPKQTPTQCIPETTLKTTETISPCLEQAKGEGHMVSSSSPRYYETTLSRYDIYTNASLARLSFDVQLMWSNSEETSDQDGRIFWRSVISPWNVYNAICQQWIYLLKDSINSNACLMSWIELPGQSFCTGARKMGINEIPAYGGLPPRPRKFAGLISELAVPQPLNLLVSAYISTRNSGNKMWAVPAFREWHEFLRIMDSVGSTLPSLMLIRDMSCQDTDVCYSNSSTLCCVIIAKILNSHTKYEDSKGLSIRNISEAVLRSYKGRLATEVLRELVYVPGLVNATLLVLLVLPFLRQVCGDERWRCNTNNEAVVCCCHFSTLFCQCARARKSRSQRKPKASGYLLDWLVITCLFSQSYTFACTDIRDNDLASYPCLDYDDDHSLFNMKCSFSWNNQTECIILLANESFEGNGHSVNLTGMIDWDGLFRIADSSNEGGGPSSLKDAPVIHDVHMTGGETSVGGGFIVQADQKHFIVKHCSSSGVMYGQSSGGIGGHRCSGDIFITHCWSSGEIRGRSAGGIAGAGVGFNDDEDSTVTISHCYSTGDIVGQWSGGICGATSGNRNHNNNNGNVIIEQCYTVGEIRGSESGGITGASTASNRGLVSIVNCYSRGNITRPDNAGGICGARTGWSHGIVLLTNVYASGQIMHDDAGGLIGHIHELAKQVNVTMSVYDGSKGGMVGDSTEGANKTIEEKNSGDLNDIIGSVYCYGDDGNCWDTETVWQPVEDGLPILLSPSLPSPLPSSSPNETQTSTTTSSHTTEARTPSASSSPLPTVTRTSTPTASLTPSITSSDTGTLTSSVSPTSSRTGTLTSIMTSSPPPTETVTSTQTVSPSGSGSNTMTPCATPSSTRASTNTPTQTATASGSPAPTGRPKRLSFMQLPVQQPRRSVVNRSG